MWTAFKAFSIGQKLAVFAGVFALLAALAGGMYMFGRSDGRQESKTAIAIYEKQVSDLNTRLATEQTKIVTQVITEYRDRTEEIAVETVRIKEVIKEVPVQYPLSNGWIYVHNSAVVGTIPNEGQASDVSPSGIFDAVALETIAGNYAICKNNAARHTALIKWVEQTLESAERINED